MATLRRAKGDLDIRAPRQMENGCPVPYFMFKHQQLPSKPGFEEVDAWLRSLDEPADVQIREKASI